MLVLCVEPPWYGNPPNAIARQLNFCYIFIQKLVQALKTLLNSAEYPVTRERVFLIPLLKILFGHINRGNQL
jgi:hypothetical protein